MFNPVIIGALIVQAIIGKFSSLAGAIVGFLITAGILVWGLSVFAEGNAIAFFGIPLSEPVFIGACIVWFFFDSKELAAAKNKRVQEEGEVA
jgi:hypothetical protein